LVYRRGRISIRFAHCGQVVQRATGDKDTAKNRERWTAWLDAAAEKILKGTFRMADAFPGMTAEEKRDWARLEGWEYRQGPDQLLVGDYLSDWTARILPGESVHSQRHHPCVIRAHLEPRFGSVTFADLNGVEMERWIRELRQRLSPKRIKNILSVLRRIWEDATEENGWDLRSPFEHLTRRNRGGRLTGQTRQQAVEVLRLDEWLAVQEGLSSHYRPIFALMAHTGIIASEAAGLRQSDDCGTLLHIRNSIVGGVHEKQQMKTAHRRRALPVTAPLREILDTLKVRALDQYLCRVPDGRYLYDDALRKEWTRACKKSGVRYRKPYVLRHTVALWLQVAGLPRAQVADIMGHADYGMLDKVYGRWQHGIEADAERITAYLGVKKSPPTNP
jgi:integrase